MSTRILIVDDHGVLRAGLAALLDLEPDLEVVGEAGDGSEAVRKAATLRPDVILMDINIPDFNGIEATQKILKLLPKAQVLILTVHDDKGLLQEAIKAGASGYILKKALKTDLIHAIRTIQQGDLYVDPVLTRRLLTEQLNQPPKPAGKLPLTGREIEVLTLIAQGYTNSQAAGLLSISTRTVEYHRSNIMAKLNLTSRVELVQYAEKHSLLNS